jgi:hypothetical protein
MLTAVQLAELRKSLETDPRPAATESEMKKGHRVNRWMASRKEGEDGSLMAPTPAVILCPSSFRVTSLERIEIPIPPPQIKSAASR